MPLDHPKVSIVLPTYNGVKYIRRSIESCLAQTYRNIELIVVDDASTNGIPEIAKSYNDRRLSYLRNFSNLGLPRSLNRGFLASTGTFLTWTSDDNYYAPQAIERMLEFLLNKNADFVYSDYFVVEQDKDNPIKVNIRPGATFKEVNFVRACFLYSRRVKEAVGEYDPETQLSEDYDYWIRVSKKFTLCHLEEPLYFYRVHSQALYCRRYWEQEIVKCLVRLRHGIFSNTEASDFLLRLWARKRRLPKIAPLNLFKFLLPGQDIAKKLSLLRENQISFMDCKNYIGSLIL